MHKNQKARQATNMKKSKLFRFDEIVMQSGFFWVKFTSLIWPNVWQMAFNKLSHNFFQAFHFV